MSTRVICEAAVTVATSRADRAESIIGTEGFVAVPATLVDDNPFNARAIYDDAVIAQLVLQLRADGQLVAALAVRSTAVPGRFTLIDGHYRLRAIRSAGLPTIRLDLRGHLPGVELFRLSYTLNVHRKSHTVLDNALAWSRLLATGLVSTQADLQAITGKSPATISKTLQLLEMPATVLHTIKSQPSRFNLKLGYALVLLCKVGGSLQASRLAERALNEDLRPAEIAQALRWAQMGKTARKSREESRKYPVEQEDCVGTIRCWKSGKVTADLSFTEPAHQALFVERLKHLIALPA